MDSEDFEAEVGSVAEAVGAALKRLDFVWIPSRIDAVKVRADRFAKRRK